MKSLILPIVHKYTVTIFLWEVLFTPLQMLSAQNKLDSVVSYFHQLQGTHQEKLYLHLDKPYYGAGDNIWYKGYLVNATSHLENPKSNFIITELINRTDSIILQRKSDGILWDFKMPAPYQVRFLLEIITSEDTLTGCRMKIRYFFIPVISK